MAGLSVYLLMTAIDVVGTTNGYPKDQWAEVKLIEAIGHVESGMNYDAVGDSGKAKGAYQLHEAAWKDAQAYYKELAVKLPAYRFWRHPGYQYTAMVGYVRVCTKRMQAAGVKNPDPRQIYLCFSMGFAAFQEIGFKPDAAPASKLSSANRVLNIFQK